MNVHAELAGGMVTYVDMIRLGSDEEELSSTSIERWEIRGIQCDKSSCSLKMKHVAHFQKQQWL